MKKGQLVYHEGLGRGIIVAVGHMFDYYKVNFKLHGEIEIYDKREIKKVK